MLEGIPLLGNDYNAFGSIVTHLYCGLCFNNQYNACSTLCLLTKTSLIALSFPFIVTIIIGISEGKRGRELANSDTFWGKFIQ